MSRNFSFEVLCENPQCNDPQKCERQQYVEQLILYVVQEYLDSENFELRIIPKDLEQFFEKNDSENIHRLKSHWQQRKVPVQARETSNQS